MAATLGQMARLGRQAALQSESMSIFFTFKPTAAMKPEELTSFISELAVSKSMKKSRYTPISVIYPYNEARTLLAQFKSHSVMVDIWNVLEAADFEDYNIAEIKRIIKHKPEECLVEVMKQRFNYKAKTYYKKYNGAPSDGFIPQRTTPGGIVPQRFSSTKSTYARTAPNAHDARTAPNAHEHNETGGQTPLCVKEVDVTTSSSSAEEIAKKVDQKDPSSSSTSQGITKKADDSNIDDGDLIHFGHGGPTGVPPAFNMHVPPPPISLAMSPLLPAPEEESNQKDPSSSQSTSISPSLQPTLASTEGISLIKEAITERMKAWKIYEPAFVDVVYNYEETKNTILFNMEDFEFLKWLAANPVSWNNSRVALALVNRHNDSLRQ